MKGLIFENVIVIKPGEIPEFYHECPWQIHPQQLQQYGDYYTYRYVPGRRATEQDVPRILQLMQDKIWRITPHTPLIFNNDKLAYIDYVCGVAYKNIGAKYPQVIDDALGVIARADLPQAEIVHGDLTLENIIISQRDEIILIDPGLSRGATTPALDRGKLLQSLVMRWEEHELPRRDTQPVWTKPRSLPGWADKVDWAFLVTHWVRLVPHWPNRDIVSGFSALAKIKENL